jgi:hypothetical protein
MDQDVRIQPPRVLEDFPAELADLFPVIPMNVLEVELEIGFVVELPVAFGTRDRIFQLFLWVTLLL